MENLMADLRHGFHPPVTDMKKQGTSHVWIKPYLKHNHEIIYLSW